MATDLKIKAQNIAGYLLAMVVFFLPLKAQYSTLFIILALVFTLPFADWKNFFSELIQNKFFLISIAYYFMHVIAISYSDNLNYAFKDVQTKLSFLIFPLVFTSIKLTAKQIDFIKKSFVAGCLIALAICFVKAFIDYNASHQSDVFFYSQFSRMMHTTYFSFYLNVALLFIIDAAYRNENSNTLRFQLQFFIVEMILLTGIFLLSARMALLVMVFTIAIFVIIKAALFKAKKKFTTVLLLSFLIAAGIQFELNSFYNRFAQIETAVQNEKKITTEIANNAAPTAAYNSTTSRIALWKYATELITSSPQTFLFGVGTGDIKDELIKVYQKNNFQKGIDDNYNPHNQYLHTMVVIGFTGLSILLSLLLYPLFKSSIRKYWTLAIFLIIILLNALTESILEVQSGIIFFCFFYCFLIAEMENKSMPNT